MRGGWLGQLSHPMSRGFPPDSVGRVGGLGATQARLLQLAGNGGPPLGAHSARGGLLRGVAPASEREPGRDSWTGMGERASLASAKPHHGDVNEPRDIDGGPGEGSLPSLTVLRSSVSLRWGGRSRASTDSPGIDSLGDRAERLAERPGLRGVRCALTDP